MSGFPQFTERQLRVIRVLPWLAVGLAVLPLLFTDVMEVDAAQYASMAREMLERGHWLAVEHRHQPYLDKPPLLFWLSASSFALFGVANWSFKLPSALFALLAVFSTYRFASSWYGHRVGRAAALVLCSSLGTVLMLNDVRTDTILMGAVMLALWQWSDYVKTRLVSSLAFGWAAAALAMLAKGPIGLMVPVIGLGVHLLISGPRGELIRPRTWLLGVLIVGALLAPMLWGLYHQYGIEGWRFFFYTQSFGRLTGDNTTWNNDGGLSVFFVHTFAWVIVPWTLFFVVGFITHIREAWRRTTIEWITLAGFVLPFIALSFSRYKLPHYIYVVLPLGAVMAGRGLIQLVDAAPSRARRWAEGVQLFLVIALWGLVLALATWAFPVGRVGVGMLLSLALLATVALIWVRGAEGRLVWAPFATILGVALVLGLHLMPTWLSYQSSAAAARLWLQQPAQRAPLFQLNTADHAIEFYSGKHVPRIDAGEARLDSILSLPQAWLFTDQRGRDSLALMPRVTVLRSEPLLHYPVQFITVPFIRPDLRASVVQQRYLMLVQPRVAATED